MLKGTTLERLLLLVFLFILIPHRSPAQQVFFTMGFEGRYLSGNTTYHISFDDSWAHGGHGESELEFPVGNHFVGFNMSVYSREDGQRFHTRTRLDVRYLTAISGSAGVMKDSDWIENDLAICGSLCTGNTPGRDLYTESDDVLASGVLMDASITRNLWFDESLALGLVLGYRYYEVEHHIKGCWGTYWGVPVSCVYARVLEYRAEHSIPYVGFNLEFSHRKGFNANLNFLYSDWVSIDDRDIHLYPDSDTATYNLDRISTCECSGSAYMVRLNTRWALTDELGIFVEGDYMDVEADGYQIQRTYVNGSLVGTNHIPIRDTISTVVWSAGIGLYYVGF